MSNSKIILVSGANRGIGFEVCRQLADLGHQLILGTRDTEKGRRALQKLPDGARSIRLDLDDPGTFAGVESIIAKEYGRLDVLVNNAAITGSSMGFDRAAVAEIKNVMETNLFGPIELTRQLLPLLGRSNNGRIINISSGMGSLDRAGGGYAAYRLSKSALNAFTAFLASDLSASNIQVNTVCPGWVRTDMGGSAASRSVEKGAETIVWLATADKIPDGKFLRDKKVIDW